VALFEPSPDGEVEVEGSVATASFGEGSAAALPGVGATASVTGAAASATGVATPVASAAGAEAGSVAAGVGPVDGSTASVDGATAGCELGAAAFACVGSVVAGAESVAGAGVESVAGVASVAGAGVESVGGATSGVASVAGAGVESVVGVASVLGATATSACAGEVVAASTASTAKTPNPSISTRRQARETTRGPRPESATCWERAQDPRGIASSFAYARCTTSLFFAARSVAGWRACCKEKVGTGLGSIEMFIKPEHRVRARIAVRAQCDDNRLSS
jgi:hypothetical protein